MILPNIYKTLQKENLYCHIPASNTKTSIPKLFLVYSFEPSSSLKVIRNQRNVIFKDKIHLLKVILIRIIARKVMQCKSNKDSAGD